MSDDPEDDDEVGYCNPPKHTQFQKGVSGNTKGRPKSRKTGLTDVYELLDEPVTVKVGGKVRTMQSFEAGFRKLANKAHGGDLRAIVRFLKFCEEYGVIAPPPAVTGGGVYQAPRGVDFHEWLNSVTEEIPVDEA